MLATGDTVTERDVRPLLPKQDEEHPLPQERELCALPYTEAKERAIEEFTKVYLRDKLAAAGGVITKAAESSGIPRQHFSLLMKRFLDADGLDES